MTVSHRNRPRSGTASQHWLSTAEAARTVLRQAHRVTEIRDRARDIHEKSARLPEPGFHILTRAMADRPIEEAAGKLSSAPLQLAGTASIALRAGPGRPARTASLVTRFGPVTMIMRTAVQKSATVAAG